MRASMQSEGDTPIELAEAFASAYNCTLTPCTESFTHGKKGGPELHLLKQTDGLFLVLLNVHMKDGSTDRHAVAYDGMHVLDNGRQDKVKRVTQRDRDDVQTARALFNSFFPNQSKATIRHIYKLQHVEAEVVSGFAATSEDEDADMGVAEAAAGRAAKAVAMAKAAMAKRAATAVKAAAKAAPSKPRQRLSSSSVSSPASVPRARGQPPVQHTLPPQPQQGAPRPPSMQPAPSPAPRPMWPLPTPPHAACAVSPLMHAPGPRWVPYAPWWVPYAPQLQ
mmetsp:Transcript_1467/g.3544  ORF Transcript_1467/g.3544 Transcript_1467/m.3544 type:complete len:279 (-) Transcript_1467:253-1089(-)